MCELNGTQLSTQRCLESVVFSTFLSLGIFEHAGLVSRGISCYHQKRAVYEFPLSSSALLLFRVSVEAVGAVAILLNCSEFRSSCFGGVGTGYFCNE